MARLMLVANPAASQFTGGNHRAIMGALSRRHTVEAVWPTSAAGANDIASDAITAGFDGVVAMGGDGIVHQVAQALVGTEVFLGVIPVGTTNVFARQMGIPAKPTRAARPLVSGPHLRRCPVLTVELTDAQGQHSVRHAVFALGAGVDADVVAAAETEPYRKYRFGAVHYARTAIGMLWRDIRRRRPNITLTAGDRDAEAIAVMAQFHRTFTYAGPRPLRFDPALPEPVSLLVVSSLKMRRLPSILARIGTGRSLSGVPGIDVWTDVEKFEMTATPPAGFELDGELIGHLSKAVVTYRPDALWVAGGHPV